MKISKSDSLFNLFLVAPVILIFINFVGNFHFLELFFQNHSWLKIIFIIWSVIAVIFVLLDSICFEGY